VRSVAATGAVLLAVAGAGCAGGTSGSRPASTTVTARPTTTTIPLGTRLCAGAVGEPISNARVGDPALIEVSGVVASRRHDGVLWVHNDSGDSARVFAIDRGGRRLGEFTLTGIRATDWEDIALLPNTSGGRDTLVVGDIGDFTSSRPSISLVFIPEPDVPADPTDPVAITDARTVEYRYPDQPHEAETVLADPRTGELIIITKEFTDVPQVFVAARGGGTAEQPALLDHAGALDLGVGQLPTAGDVAPDGSAVLVRTYSDVFVFERGPHDTIPRALRGAPCKVPAPREPQGEAIAVLADGSAYVTIGEGAGVPIWEVAIC